MNNRCFQSIRYFQRPARDHKCTRTLNHTGLIGTNRDLDRLTRPNTRNTGRRRHFTGIPVFRGRPFPFGGTRPRVFTERFSRSARCPPGQDRDKQHDQHTDAPHRKTASNETNTPPRTSLRLPPVEPHPAHLGAPLVMFAMSKSRRIESDPVYGCSEISPVLDDYSTGRHSMGCVVVDIPWPWRPSGAVGGRPPGARVGTDERVVRRLVLGGSPTPTARRERNRRA